MMAVRLSSRKERGEGIEQGTRATDMASEGTPGARVRGVLRKVIDH